MKNNYIQITILLLVLLFVVSTTSLAACGDQESDNENGENENKAVTEVTDLFNKYYIELNNKNYDSLKDYYASPEEDIDSMIENFKFMATIFDISYELKEVEATYLDNGDISASVITVSNSVNINTNSTTVMKESATYLLAKENNSLKIVKYAIGESEVISIDD